MSKGAEPLVAVTRVVRPQGILLARADHERRPAGWVVGVAKLTQVLMTSAGGEYATSSEGRAEALLIAFVVAKAACNLVVGGMADAYGPGSSAHLKSGFRQEDALLGLREKIYRVDR